MPMVKIVKNPDGSTTVGLTFQEKEKEQQKPQPKEQAKKKQ